MNCNRVKIIQNGMRNAKVFIDDVEVKGLRAVNYSSDVESIPLIKLEFFATDLVEIEINNDAVG